MNASTAKYGLCCIEVIFILKQTDRAVPSRRLDDRIRDLCARISHASESEYQEVLQQLRGAISEKTDRVRRMAARNLLRTQDLEERRTERDEVKDGTRG